MTHRLPPEDEQDRERFRFGAYVLGQPTKSGRRQPVQVAATPTKEGIGPMLVTLANDRKTLAEATGSVQVVPVVGVLDRVAHRWITSLWHEKEGV